MAIGNLEQALAVNPFRDKIEVERKPEAVQDVEIEISEKTNENIHSVLEKYKFVMDHCGFYSIKDTLSQFKPYNFLPLEIDLLLQCMLQQVDKKKAEHYFTGELLSLLIKNSYQAGNNNFYLTTKDYQIDRLMNNIEGTKNNPISAVIYGNAGAYLGQDTMWAVVEVKGSVGYKFAERSFNTVYILNTVSACTPNHNSFGCVYKIKDAETYDEICHRIDRRSNHLFLIDDNIKNITHE